MKYHGFSVSFTPVEENEQCVVTIVAYNYDGKECTILGNVWESHIPLDDSILVAEDIDTWIGDKLGWINVAFTRDMMFGRATGSGPLTPKGVTRKKDLR